MNTTFNTKSLVLYLILSLFYLQLQGQRENTSDDLDQAKEWRKKSQYTAAENSLRALLKLEVNNIELKADILFEYGYVQILQKKYENIDTLFSQASKLYLESNKKVKWASCQLKKAFIILETNSNGHNEILKILSQTLQYEKLIKEENPALLHDIYNNMAVSYYYIDDLKKMNESYNKIFDLSQSYPLENITVIINLANHFAINHEIFKSLNLVNQAEKQLKGSNFDKEHSVNYINSLAYIYLLADKHDEGVSFMRTFYNTIDNPKLDINAKHEYFEQLGDIYFTKDDFISSLHEYKKSHNYFNSKDQKEKKKLDIKILLCKAKLSKSILDINTLIAFFEKSKSIFSPYMKAFMDLQIAKIQYDINNYNLAKFYLASAKTFYQKDEDEKRLKSVMILESSINNILKNILSKKVVLSSYKYKVDSLVSQEKNALEALTIKNANDQKAIELGEKELEISKEREINLKNRLRIQNISILSILGASIFIFALYKYRNRLRKQKALAKAREEELQSYNYFVSHDLLQPVNNIKNLIAQLSNITTVDKEKINTQLVSAQNIIERLLQLFKIDKMDLYSSQFLTNEWIHKVTREYKNLHPKISWHFMMEQTTDFNISADQFLLTQCVKNILDNAIKYGTVHENPTITISTSISKNQFTLKIADNGTGVPKGTESKLFEPFKQLDPSKKGSGFGVGLSIVKKIIEKHDGLINAQNVSNGGLEIKITLPIN